MPSWPEDSIEAAAAAKKAAEEKEAAEKDGAAKKAAVLKAAATKRAAAVLKTGAAAPKMVANPTLAAAFGAAGGKRTAPPQMAGQSSKGADAIEAAMDIDTPKTGSGERITFLQCCELLVYLAWNIFKFKEEDFYTGYLDFMSTKLCRCTPPSLSAGERDKARYRIKIEFIDACKNGEVVYHLDTIKRTRDQMSSPSSSGVDEEPASKKAAPGSLVAKLNARKAQGRRLAGGNPDLSRSKPPPSTRESKLREHQAQLRKRQDSLAVMNADKTKCEAVIKEQNRLHWSAHMEERQRHNHNLYEANNKEWNSLCQDISRTKVAIKVLEATIKSSEEMVEDSE